MAAASDRLVTVLHRREPGRGRGPSALGLPDRLGGHPRLDRGRRIRSGAGGGCSARRRASDGGIGRGALDGQSWAVAGTRAWAAARIAAGQPAAGRRRSPPHRGPGSPAVRPVRRVRRTGRAGRADESARPASPASETSSSTADAKPGGQGVFLDGDRPRSRLDPSAGASVSSGLTNRALITVTSRPSSRQRGGGLERLAEQRAAGDQQAVRAFGKHLGLAQVEGRPGPAGRLSTVVFG